MTFPYRWHIGKVRGVVWFEIDGVPVTSRRETYIRALGKLMAVVDDYQVLGECSANCAAGNLTITCGGFVSEEDAESVASIIAEEFVLETEYACVA